MPLPAQAIEQITRGAGIKTQGWTGKLLMFSVTALIVVTLSYFGLEFGYKSYLDKQSADLDAEIKSSAQQIPSNEQSKILVFYSQLANLGNILDKHTTLSGLLEFLESRTQQNVYYTGMNVAVQNQQVNLSGIAKSMSDVTEQMMIFQQDKLITKALLLNVVNGNGTWQFEVVLTVDPQLLNNVNVGTSSNQPVETIETSPTSTSPVVNPVSAGSTSTPTSTKPQ